MKLRFALFIWLVQASIMLCLAQTDSFRTRLADYFSHYPLGISTSGEISRIERIVVDDSTQVVQIHLNEVFGMQPFTHEKVEAIYADVRQMVTAPYESYRLVIYSKNHPIEDLVIGGWDGHATDRLWRNTAHVGNPWVTPMSRIYPVNEGLDGQHISLWASHGRYFSLSEQSWQWQRPNLFCTTEDLLSQTIVVPYLMPMLENAGAVVYSPRERDWQKHEVIVDNDRPQQNGLYIETCGRHAWEPSDSGFAHTKDIYLDGDNPFRDGTARRCVAQPRKSQTSSVVWTPTIPADGRYAVYVSYVTLPTSVSDAVYTVRHRGMETRFRVNQQMGGSTWVYLGSFEFAAGNSHENCVILTNQSKYKGHITADAVRFGGGMGNIARGDSAHLSVSGLPRFLECARYAAQWAGMPRWAYATKGSQNDYAEDINVRSLATNHLARGSAFVPSDSGLHVPIEMSIALHTDAGYSRDGHHVGSLGIYTTDHNEGVLPAGLSRLTSRDLCDIVLSKVDSDLKNTYGEWTRRAMFDRNYSETREPEVPSTILEMLSHQNFADMCRAHDPAFKFTLARAIYKGILHYSAQVHGKKSYVVQPLPVTAPAAEALPGSRRIHLTWQATDDPLEPSAVPTDFVIYHSVGAGGYDNGTIVSTNSFTLNDAAQDVLHRFIITAVNAGGQSMPSQEVCAYLSSASERQILIVDGFDRLAGPQPVNNDSLQGFDMGTDMGVPMAIMPGYSGKQRSFNRKTMGREGPGAMGFSGNELEGILIAGNTRDWCSRHAIEIIAASNGQITLSSCSSAALSRDIAIPRTYQLMDVVLGLEKTDGYSLTPSQAFTPALRSALAMFTRGGGNVLVSGAYLGSDMTTDNDRLFTRSVLHYEYAGALRTDTLASIMGMNTESTLFNAYNEQSYAVSAVDCLAPTQPAFCTMTYGQSGPSAAVAYLGTDYRSICLGFPLEAVVAPSARRQLWNSILQFLMP